MNTVLAPGVSWPKLSKAPTPRPVRGKRGGYHVRMTDDEVLLLRELRDKGKSLLYLEGIFHRGKATLIAAIKGRGIYEGVGA